jgi:hypothetical protein
MDTWQIVYAQFVNGELDPNWVVTLELGIIAFLLVRVLNRIEKKLEVHDKQITELDKKVAVIESQKL